tara:strand:- start:3 stop:1157 length:1155 start_codon:yes stop_codon:yes gene_type:complete
MALSTNRTLITQTGINTHQVLNVGGLDSAGIATFSNFKTGLSNVHSIGFDVGSAVTIRSTGDASFTGVITASKFVGDISDATGAAAGLGTALSQTQTDPLNKIYFTNRVLSISTTTTIDPPDTASAAYTQYSDIVIENGHDLIIKDGDDFKYDILGISTTAIKPSVSGGSDSSGALSGNLIGSVTGNVTGNLTGNVTGNVTGTASNASGATGDFSIADKIIHTGDTDTTIRFPAADTITAETGGSERLRISPEGYVTNPSRPYFKANKTLAITGTGVVVWDSVVFNNGGHYSGSNGKFIAPIDGLYWFTAKINHYRRCDFWFQRNGSRFERGQYNTNDVQGWWSSQLTAIIELDASDYIEVYVNALTQNSDPGEWLTFMGYLLS